MAKTTPNSPRRGHAALADVKRVKHAKHMCLVRFRNPSKQCVTWNGRAKVPGKEANYITNVTKSAECASPHYTPACNILFF